MNELEKLDIYVLEDPDSDASGGTPVASFDKSDIAKKTATITLPDTLQSGKYYIRAVYSKEDVTATRSEDNEIYAVLGGSSESSATDEKGKTTTRTEGLKANGRYVVSAKPFNMLKDSENNVKGLTYGEESFSDEITLNQPNKATITLSADKRKYQIGREEYAKDENDKVVQKTVMYDTYDSSAINFTASADMKVSGTWMLDSDEKMAGSFTDTTSIPIAFSNLPDGDHTLTIEGKNENGDGFMESFVFNIDTAAPSLLLSSPVNGSGFEENGKLTISGITENDAYISVNVDGNPVIRSKTLKELNAVMGEEGDFTFDVNIGKGY